MKLLYLWINCSENGFIRRQGFNIAGDQFWEFDEEKKTLSSKKKAGYIKGFWNNNCIEDLSVIVGTNGAGKSTLLSGIMGCGNVLKGKSYASSGSFERENGQKIVVYEENGRIYYDHNLDYEIDTWPATPRKELISLKDCSKIFVSNSMNNPVNVASVQKESVHTGKDVIREISLTDGNIEIETKLYRAKNKLPDYVYASEEDDDSRYYDDPNTHHGEKPYIELVRQLNNKINLSKIASLNARPLLRLYFLANSKCKKYMGKTYDYVTIQMADFREIYNIDYIEGLLEETDILLKKINGLKQKKDYKILNTLIIYFLYEFLSCYNVEGIVEIEEVSLEQVKKVKEFVKDQVHRDIEDSLQENMTTAEYFVNAADDIQLFAKLIEDNKSFYCKNVLLWGDSNKLKIKLNQNKEFFDRLFLFYERGISSIFMRYLKFEFEGLSSGEEAMLNLYSRIFWAYNAYECKKESLILIDEIDLYMHPKWQRELINYLIEDIGNLIGKENKAQIIITTHSPIILSDIPKSNILFLEGKDGTCVVDDSRNHRDTFGNNVHTLFLDSFFLSDDGTMGAFAENKINGIIDLLLSRAKIDDENHSILNTINIIGDDLIRNKLLSLYEEKTNRMLFPENRKSEKEINAIDASIEVIKEQIRSLQNAIIELEQMK